MTVKYSHSVSDCYLFHRLLKSRNLKNIKVDSTLLNHYTFQIPSYNHLFFSNIVYKPQ
jgi:hypothetical protein